MNRIIDGLAISFVVALLGSAFVWELRGTFDLDSFLVIFSGGCFGYAARMLFDYRRRK